MTKYDDLFDGTRPDQSVFADKGALDPLAEPEEIIARDDQERQLATILNGVHEGYLPTTLSIYGPPGTGKTMTTRRVCREFAARTPCCAVEYVNLKECRTLFSAANEILLELTGERKQAYAGLDGVFQGIWTALEAYPAYTVLILDEIDHIAQDSNYDPNEFFYRLLRGEGRLSRDLNLSVFLLSNELLNVDLRLDSRVRSAMSGEEIFFPPYGQTKLDAILEPRLEQAFRDGALPAPVRERAILEAARRWGDVRKTLTLFRQAGETATEEGREVVTEECITTNLETTEQAAVQEKLMGLPFNHFYVLIAIISYHRGREETAQPVTTAQVTAATQWGIFNAEFHLGERAVRGVIMDLETMGLVETWIESRGRDGRVKQIETTFEPQWVQDAVAPYLAKSDQVSPEDLFKNYQPPIRE